MSQTRNDTTSYTAQPHPPVKVFYSYSHKDEEFLEKLVIHLSLLKRRGVITGWHDRQINAGTEWKNQIDEHLESSDIILLLVSADFLASDYCYDLEMARAMERHAERTARVIPIILRKCDWSDAPFGKLQALPKDAKPVKGWADQDEAFADIVEGIKKAIAQLPLALSSPATNSQPLDQRRDGFSPQYEQHFSDSSLGSDILLPSKEALTRKLHIKYILAVPVVLILILIIMGYLRKEHSPYLQMTGEDKLGFVEGQFLRINKMLGGDVPMSIEESTAREIKRYVDGYAARTSSLSKEPWKEGLRSIFGRASQYAPIINQAFKERSVPNIIGLYLPMIETEYQSCMESSKGALGLFPFIPASAKEYNVDPDDRCNVEKIAPVAAQYISDKIAEFGTDWGSLTLAISSFSCSSESIRLDLIQLRRQRPDVARDFWSLFEKLRREGRSPVSKTCTNEYFSYIPKFYAAAIIGENPETFDLPIRPLSTY